MFYLKQVETLSRVTLTKPLATIDREIITPEAMEFLARLHSTFEDRRRKLLARRSVVQREIDMGIIPGFPESTRGIREGLWRVRTAPADLTDRMVEIRVPAGNRRSVIEGLNSGANVFVGDFEDSQSPTWLNTIEGQRNLRDAVRRNLSWLSPEGENHTLRGETTTLMVRPRGWHMNEKHFIVDGEPVSASLFDFGLYLFHNGRELIERGSGPYFTLPKIENRFEAALWNDVFTFAEEFLGLPPAAVRATVQIDSVLAALEMDEILYELRDRSAGLRCERLSYIFSVIKNFRTHDRYVIPDSGPRIHDQEFLNSCTTLLVQACHRRGAHAIGALAAELTATGDPEADERALNNVHRDKLREARQGHDGTWISHPGLVDVTRDAFGSVMTNTNQLGVLRQEVAVSQEDLLRVSNGEVSESGLRENIGTAVHYIESWLSGNGTISRHGVEQDASAAEVSRALVWQWLRHTVRLREHSSLTPTLFRTFFSREMENIRAEVHPERYRRGQFELASRICFNLVHHQNFPGYFTTSVNQYL